MKPIISVVTCHVPLSKEFDEMLEQSRKSLMGMYDEYILVINDLIGYGRAHNFGFRMAKGDFIIAVSNDAFRIDGKLEDMCDPTAVTYSSNSQFGCFFCLPRWVLNKVGYFDERIGKAYHEDNNYLSRLNRAGVPLKRINSIKVEHFGGATIKAAGKESEFMAGSKPIYEEIEKALDQGESYYVPPCGNSCKDKSDCLWHCS